VTGGSVRPLIALFAIAGVVAGIAMLVVALPLLLFVYAVIVT
jgi:hypothetical protein